MEKLITKNLKCFLEFKKKKKFCSFCKVDGMVVQKSVFYVKRWQLLVHLGIQDTNYAFLQNFCHLFSWCLGSHTPSVYPRHPQYYMWIFYEFIFFQCICAYCGCKIIILILILELKQSLSWRKTISGQHTLFYIWEKVCEPLLPLKYNGSRGSPTFSHL